MAEINNIQGDVCGKAINENTFWHTTWIDTKRPALGKAIVQSRSLYSRLKTWMKFSMWMLLLNKQKHSVRVILDSVVMDSDFWLLVSFVEQKLIFVHLPWNYVLINNLLVHPVGKTCVLTAFLEWGEEKTVNRIGVVILLAGVDINNWSVSETLSLRGLFTSPVLT